MKITNIIASVLITAVMSLLTVTAFAAQEKSVRGSGGWGMGGAYQRMYNPATVETVTGKVTAVERAVPMKGMGSGIHLQLKTDKETIPVHLGPAWYIQRLDEEIRQGDTIEVTGSRVTVAGKPAIIAAEVKKGDALLTLRDNSGTPAWSGWRRR
jgi:hypothetical protein